MSRPCLPTLLCLLLGSGSSAAGFGRSLASSPPGQLALFAALASHGFAEEAAKEEQGEAAEIVEEAAGGEDEGEGEDEDEGEDEEQGAAGLLPPVWCHAADALSCDQSVELQPDAAEHEMSSTAPAGYQAMATEEEAAAELQCMSESLPGRKRPQLLELDVGDHKQGDAQATPQVGSVSGGSTRTTMACSEFTPPQNASGRPSRQQSRGRMPPTPRTRARGRFVASSMALVPTSVRTLPDIMLCRGLLILMLLWVSALFWALSNACSQDFEDSREWPSWLNFLADHPIGVLEVENFVFQRPSPYFQPHAVTCPIAGKFFMADRFRVFDLPEAEADGTPGRPRPFPCDVKGTIADIAAICDGEGECWPVVLLDGTPSQVFDCKRNETWNLLQVSTPASRVATMGPSSDKVGLDTLFASEGGKVVQYRRSVHRHGYAPEWVVQDYNTDVLALDVVGSRLVVFKSNSLVEYQDLDTGALCGRWRIPSDRKVIGGGCARGSTIHILAREGHSIHILKSSLPQVERCKGPSHVMHEFDV
uniref:Uncharacterized protein n=1 Tax=Alexandrium monilatum TaxID=311494 RepID=A0A7S4RMI7_9DINO